MNRTRLGYLLGFFACAAVLGGALYLQYMEQQEPCPLCILQRVAVIAVGAVFLVAALHAPHRTGAWVYSGMITLFAAAGAAVSGRHLWLQHLPKDQVPACGPGLEYMLKRFPLNRALEKIFSGSGECAEAGWQLFGLTLPALALIAFIGFAILALAVAYRAKAR